MSEYKNEEIAVKRPIQSRMRNASILFALCLVLLLIAVFQFFFLRILYRQYDRKLSETVCFVENSIDADDLRGCIESGERSESYDELQLLLNRTVDDLGLEYLYITIPEETVMVNAISATSAADTIRATVSTGACWPWGRLTA